jgi:hypothetical protein
MILNVLVRERAAATEPQPGSVQPTDMGEDCKPFPIELLEEHGPEDGLALFEQPDGSFLWQPHNVTEVIQRRALPGGVFYGRNHGSCPTLATWVTGCQALFAGEWFTFMAFPGRYTQINWYQGIWCHAYRATTYITSKVCYSDRGTYTGIIGFYP